MGAADERLEALLARWQASVDLHARCLALDDAAYARVQDWPAHQRPTRWVVELARTRLQELKALLAERRTRNDDGFADALERMAFLTNLLGTEHVERFIPLAKARAATKAASRPQASAAAAKSKPAAPAKPVDPTVKMQTRRRAPPPAPAPAPTAAPDKATSVVIADAVRMLSWGREWPQLASLIARMANRPAEADVLKILRQHRAMIETQARQPRD